MSKKFMYVCAFLCCLNMPVYASKLSDKKEELKKTESSIKEAEKEIANKKNQQSKLENEIETLDREIIQAENKLQALDKELDMKQIKVQEAKENLIETQEDLDNQVEASKDRMVQNYKNRKGGYIQVLFSSDNFSQMLNRMKYIQVISSHDQDLIDDLETLEKEREKAKNHLEEEERNLQNLYNEQESYSESLSDKRRSKNAIIDDLKKDQEALEGKIDELEKYSKEVEADIKRLTAQSSKKNQKYTGGKFSWPLANHFYISSEYNPRNNPISGRAEFHSGLDIPAPYGTSVLAAADGEVIYSARRGGYGNTIMIDHGSGLVTLYGHNSSLVARVGQQVKKGDVIARVGSTGNSTGNHVHFEVRKNGGHVNPWNYLK